MKAAPRQQRAIRKRSALIEAALAEFSEKGFEATTARSIAVRAGVATGTFYQHFHNKDEVLVEIARQRFVSLHEHLRTPEVTLGPAGAETDGSASAIHGVFRDALNFVYDFHHEEAGLHQVLEQRRRLDPQLGAVMDAGEAVLLERIRNFVARYLRENVETTAFCLFAMAEGLVHRHVFQGVEGLSRTEIIEQGARLLAAFLEQKAAVTARPLPSTQHERGSHE